MTKEEVLHDLGLSKNEIEAYLRLLELGPATAVSVAKATKLHRPNVYDALERLVQKGLVAYFTQEKTKYYEVVEPEQLMTLLKAKESQLHQIIPELKIMRLQAKPQSSIAIFEGISGARKVWMDMITDTKELYLLGAPKDLVKMIGEAWVYDWHLVREKRKVMFYHIVNEDYYPHRIKIIRNFKHTRIKFLPKQYNAPHGIFINDHGVAFLFIEPLVTIKMYKPEVAKSFKSYFKLMENLALDKAPQEK
jgi:sugar-specific transcriptional regulator TrmB